MLNKLKILSLSLILLLMIAGCNRDKDSDIKDELVQEEKTDTVIDSHFKDLKMDSIDIEVIGNVQDKLNDSTEVDSITLDLKNIDRPINLVAGAFYNFKINLDMDKVSVDGLHFSLTLAKNSGYSKVLSYKKVEESDNIEEGSLDIEVFIPATIDMGKYIMAITLIDADLERVVSVKNSVEDIPEIGAFYVDIQNNDDSKRVEVVDCKPDNQYIDLPYKSEFKNGYSNRAIGSSSMVFFNSSFDKEIIFSAKLELESGLSIDLGILDTDSGTIRDRIRKDILSYTGKDMQSSSFEYYVKKSDYESLVKLLPDLSIDRNINGVEAKIVWDIKSATYDIDVINNTTDEITLTKFKEDFSYYDDIDGEEEAPDTYCSAKNQEINKEKFLDNGLLFSYEDKVEKKYGDRKQISLEFNADYSFKGLWKVPAVEALANLDITAYILNEYALEDGFNILKIEAKVGVSSNKKHPFAEGSQTSSTGGSMDIVILGSSIYQKNNITTENITDSIDENSTEDENKKDLEIAENKNKDKGFSMPSYSWKEEKTIFKTSFPIGPVPFSVEAGISGDLAVDLAFEFDGVGVELGLKTPLSLSSFLRGGVDILLAQAGIEGEAKLLEILGEASLGGKLDMKRDKLAFNIYSKATLDLKVLSGKLSVYAQTKTKVKWCDGWVDYPCGLDWDKWTHSLYNSPWAYNKVWTIIDEDKNLLELPLTDLMEEVQL